ncbi:hypothetical protein FRB95_003754 [Tulasnella sp. JGI-2019a]|nr:hypothetical protein FRB95_003754 [Tulasnella sp. JGI-2019a]
MIRPEPLGKAPNRNNKQQASTRQVDTQEQCRCLLFLLIRVIAQHEIIKNGWIGSGLSPGFAGGHAASLGLL